METKRKERITHDAVELYRRARKIVLRHGMSDGEGGLYASMTYGAFAREFGLIRDLRGSIDVLESAFPRIGFYLMPDRVVISFGTI